MKEFDDRLLRFLDNPFNVVAAALGCVLLLVVVLSGRTLLFYARFVFKSLSRNLLRSVLTGLATTAFVQKFPNGAVLLTGAGVVPPDSFTLEAHDSVRITISGVGTLENPVSVV